MYKAVTLAGGIREPLLTCSSWKYNGQSKIKINVFFSTEPQVHRERSTMFFDQRCSLRLLHLVLNRAWYI